MIAALIKIINKQIVEDEDKVIFGQDELMTHSNDEIFFVQVQKAIVQR